MAKAIRATAAPRAHRVRATTSDHSPSPRGTGTASRLMGAHRTRLILVGVAVQRGGTDRFAGAQHLSVPLRCGGMAEVGTDGAGDAAHSASRRCPIITDRSMLVRARTAGREYVAVCRGRHLAALRLERVQPRVDEVADSQIRRCNGVLTAVGVDRGGQRILRFLLRRIRLLRLPATVTIEPRDVTTHVFLRSSRRSRCRWPWVPLEHSGEFCYPTRHFGSIVASRNTRCYSAPLAGIEPAKAAPAEPARQPAAELGAPRRRDHTAPLPVCGPRVLRPQTRRGQEHQGSDPRVEASTLQRRSTGPWSPTPADSSSDRRAREDNQERHEIQRDRLNILNGRLFG